MNLTPLEIEDYYGSDIFLKGFECFRKKGIKKYKDGSSFDIKKIDDYNLIKAIVEGDDLLYSVHFPIYNNSLTLNSLNNARCNCETFSAYKKCEHVIAASLEYINAKHIMPKRTIKDSLENLDVSDKSKLFFDTMLGLINDESEYKKAKRKSINSDYVATKIINSYAKNSLDVKEFEPVKLIPKIHSIGDEYPHISFYVGNKKMYVVKQVNQFLLNVKDCSNAFYGKELQFVHSIENFDSKSQKLIQILNNQNNQSNKFYADTSHFSYNKRCIHMDGNCFLMFFDLYIGETIEIDDWVTNKVTLIEGDPELKLVVTNTKNGATIYIDTEEDLEFFGNEYALYALYNDVFLKCSPAFSKKIFPLTSFVEEEFFVSENDLPSFCDMFVTTVNDFVTIEDEDAICEKFIPDECLPRFYFDILNNEVVAKLAFLYNDLEINEKPTAAQLKKINRNVKVEERTKSMFKNYFHESMLNDFYTLKKDADLFLTDEINNFKNFGEIFLSESLKNKFVDTKKQASIGISVSNGLLNLNIDTQEFPPEELGELYNSFLKKKKYHKLKDGRFLFLENSGYEKIAEISHMLQLKPKELTKNEITLPAYRGLYLDCVLLDSENVKTTKSNKFSKMLEEFNTIDESGYNIPTNLNAKLRPYQVTGFLWLRTLEKYSFGGILADEMGLGKTLQVITFLLSLKEENPEIKPSLIICPASLLYNWEDEIKRFAPTINALLILGNAKIRQQFIDSDDAKNADIWITSYDLVKRDRDAYENKSFHCVILDEAQYIKNQSTIISKTVKTISANHRYVLTGTPIENRLSELWNLFDFLMPGYLFSHNAFVNKLEKPIVKSEEALAKKQLNLLVKPFIMRRLKKDVLKDLPDKMEYVHKIQLTEHENKVYLSAVANVKAKANETKSKLQILALLTQLRQICCDPNICFANYNGESSKLEACLELISSMIENGHKVLLFSQFTTMLDIIRGRLAEMEISNLTIEGSTSKEKRALNVKKFQDGLADVFLISLKAGGTGLNLTCADVVIHYDPWWNQAAQNQATDRAHRIGQIKHVQVYKLIVKNTIEEKILKLQEKKAALMDNLMDDAYDVSLTSEDIMALLD